MPVELIQYCCPGHWVPKHVIKLRHVRFRDELDVLLKLLIKEMSYERAITLSVVGDYIQCVGVRPVRRGDAHVWCCQTSWCCYSRQKTYVITLGHLFNSYCVSFTSVWGIGLNSNSAVSLFNILCSLTNGSRLIVWRNR